MLLPLFLATAVLCGACDGGRGGSAEPPGGLRAVPAPVVATTGGEIRGVVAGDVASFYGIPYAAPPVGNLRWRAPAPPVPWQGVRDGSVRGHPCPQTEALAAAASEDCLFVNVTAPTAAVAAAGATSTGGSTGASTGVSTGVSGGASAGASATARTGEVRRPVLVWIHGGGFAAGSANEVDMSALAAGGPAVLVGVNYRLGALGQLALPALTTESGGDAGSYAVADIIAALRWVRDNAAAFGGDPGNITIFGESAGSVNVCAVLAAPSARGLVQRAVMQSGPCLWPFPAMAAAERTGEAFAAQLGCTDPATVLGCLRATPVERVLDMGGQVDVLTSPRWAPVTGSLTLPRPPGEAIAEGAADRIPVIVGTVRDEGRAFTVNFDPGRELTVERFTQIVREQMPDRADAVLAAYPPGAVPPRERLAQVITDRFFACPTARSADLFTRAGSRVYGYEFDVPGLTPVIAGVNPGATHAAELPYLFPTGSSGSSGSSTSSGPAGFAAGPSAGPSLTPDQRDLSAAMIDYWTRFAAAGDPNAASSTGPLPTWPSWPVTRTPTSPDRLVLQPGTIEAGAGYAAAHHCEIWG